MTISSAAQAVVPESDRMRIRRLMLFFALVYIVEGAGQTDGLIAQPLNYYLKQVFQWTPVQISAYLTILNLPWFIKPLYGAVSDFVPLFGYRRKVYLILANAAAVVAYFVVTQVAEPSRLIVLLLLTAYGMAISSTLCGALLVENGQKFRASGTFVNQQWLWYNVAAMASALVGGMFVQFLDPTAALHASAAIVGLVSTLAIFGAVALVDEEPSAISVQGLKETLAGLAAAFRERDLWVLALFLFFYYFSPGFVTPLYFYMTDSLQFSQQYIGILSAIQYAGWIAGGLIYRAYLQDLTSKKLLNLSIALGVVTTCSFLLLADEVTAALAQFCYGVGLMILIVATSSLAADYCPKRSEGFVFAALISVTNLSGSLADNVGSYLFEQVFENRLYPLVIVSAAFTGLAFFVVPFLKLGSKAQGEPALDANSQIASHEVDRKAL